MWIVTLHQLSTTLCGFFRNLSKSVISSLSKSYIWGSIEINCISLSNEFGTNVFRSSVERKVKTENRLPTFAVVGVVNTETFMSFIKLPFYKQTGYSQQFNSLFFGDIFWAPIPVNQYEIRSGYSPDIRSELCRQFIIQFLAIKTNSR